MAKVKPISDIRSFDGKCYHLHDAYFKKSDALRVAKRLRRDRGRARVVPVGRHWVVYVR